MPEGDTIYRATRALQRALGGKVVTGFETGLAKLARVNDDATMVGRVVEKVESRGKWLLIYFSGDLILVTHMLTRVGSLASVPDGGAMADEAVEDASGDSGGGLGGGGVQCAGG